MNTNQREEFNEGTWNDALREIGTTKEEEKANIRQFIYNCSGCAKIIRAKFIKIITGEKYDFSEN